MITDDAATVFCIFGSRSRRVLGRKICTGRVSCEMHVPNRVFSCFCTRAARTTSVGIDIIIIQQPTDTAGAAMVVLRGEGGSINQ